MDIQRNKELRTIFLGLLYREVQGSTLKGVGQQEFKDIFSENLADDEDFDSIYYHLAQSKLIRGDSSYIRITNYGISELERLETTCSQHLSSSSPDVKFRREGVFINGKQFDALYLVHELITSASNKIIIIDPFPKVEILKILSSKDSSVIVNIFGRLPDVQKQAFLTFANQFNADYRGLSVRGGQLPIKFHDRFMFVDDRDFYHFGSSFEGLGKKVSMFSKIEEPMIISQLKDSWNQEWRNATVVI